MLTTGHGVLRFIATAALAVCTLAMCTGVAAAEAQPAAKAGGRSSYPRRVIPDYDILADYARWTNFIANYKPDYSDSSKYLEPPPTGRIGKPIQIARDGKALAEIVVDLSEAIRIDNFFPAIHNHELRAARGHEERAHVEGRAEPALDAFGRALRKEARVVFGQTLPDRLVGRVHHLQIMRVEAQRTRRRRQLRPRTQEDGAAKALIRQPPRSAHYDLFARFREDHPRRAHLRLGSEAGHKVDGHARTPPTSTANAATYPPSPDKDSSTRCAPRRRAAAAMSP